MVEVKFAFMNYYGRISEIVNFIEPFLTAAKRACPLSKQGFRVTMLESDTVELVLVMDERVYTGIFVPQTIAVNIGLRGGNQTEVKYT